MVLCTRDYLGALLAYLESFYERTQPLTPLSKLYARLEDFEDRWESGQVVGWEQKGSAPGAPATAAPQIDVDAFDSVEELETLGKGCLWMGP